MHRFTIYCFLTIGAIVASTTHTRLGLAGPGHKHLVGQKSNEASKAEKKEVERPKIPRLLVEKPKQETIVSVGESGTLTVMADSGSDFWGEVTLTLEHEEWDEIDKKSCLKTVVDPEKTTFKKNEKKKFTVTMTTRKDCPVLAHQHLHIMLWLQQNGQTTQYLQNIELGFSTVK